MTTIYEYDERKVFSGQTKEISSGDGAPMGWTRSAPPETDSGEWAVFSGKNGWRVVNTEPAFPASPVPVSVTRRQFMQQLIVEGLDDDAETLIDAITDPTERKLMRSWYRDSQVFERDRPELIQMASSMGKTPNDLDQFFREANER